MNDSEIDKLIERSLAGPGPREVFREQVLRDSSNALAKRSRPGTFRRAVGLAAAGILIAVVSFFWGRASSRGVPIERRAAVQQGTETGQTVAVPADLVAWLRAARLFEQLGMKQRVTLAYEHAARLVPGQTYGPDNRSLTVLATESDGNTKPSTNPLSPDIPSVLAQSFGG